MTHIQDATTQKKHNRTLQRPKRLFYFVAYQHMPMRCTTALTARIKSKRAQHMQQFKRHKFWLDGGVAR